MGWGNGNLGGGSGGLNFKIVGGKSEPSSQKENMIWVDTDEKITGYTINATEPENPIPGMVWITPGASGEAVVTVTKKNPIKVYPVSAKQYNNGAWMDVTAKNRQNGEWVDWWNGELYEPGNMYDIYTGGWVKGEYIAGDATTITTSDITLNVGTGTRTHVETAQKVEFGDNKTLKATVDIINCPTASNVVRLGYSSKPKANLASATTKNELTPGKNFSGEFTITLDISSAPSSAYVVIGAGVSGTVFKVKKVQMTK